jgi:hypothetical protein
MSEPFVERPPARRRRDPRSRAERRHVRLTDERDRQRRYRARRKAGKVCFSIAAPENQLIEALLRTSRLTEEEALDHARVEAALADVLVDWAARWTK